MPVEGAGVATAAYLLLGSAILFPWNALLTAADWWNYTFGRNKDVDRLFTIVYLPVNVVVLSLMIRYHASIRPGVRIVAGLTGFTLSMLAVPLIDMAGNSDAVLAALLGVVGCVGACDGLAQGALFGEAALLPGRFTQALISGTSLSGVVVSLLRIATKAMLPDTPQGLRTSAISYFLLSASVCATSTVVYLLLPRMRAVRHYRAAALDAALAAGADLGPADLAGPARRRAAAAEDQQLTARSRSPSPLPAGLGARRVGRTSLDLELSSEDHLRSHQIDMDDDDGPGGADAGAQQALLPHRHARRSPEWGGAAGRADGWGGGGAASPGKTEAWLGSPARGRRHAEAVDGWRVLRGIWRLALANMLTFIITLSIFPGVLAEWPTTDAWFTVLLLSAYSAADCAGKSLPSIKALRVRSPSGLLLVAAARAGFVPAFHLAAVRSVGPPVVAALTLALGISNGFTTASAMMAAPEGLHGKAAALAGNLMVFALVIGLCLGAAASFLWLL